MTRKTIFVFKTHLDVGYTDLSSVVLENYRGRMLDDVFKVFQEDGGIPFGNQYVWTLPAWLLYEIVTYGHYPREKQEQILSYVRSGRLAWHALPYTTHTEAAGLEEFIRGLHYGRQLSAMFGKKYISAKMTDVPGHTSMLPSLLAKAGIKFLHLGCNQCCTPPDVPSLFWWEGPDGGRVLTFYSHGGYGSSRVPPDDWKYPVWLCMELTGDNQGTRSLERISADLEEAHRLSGAACAIGTMDDFYHEIIRCELDLPIIRGDIGDTWIHGAGTYPREEREIRTLRRELQALEKLYFELDSSPEKVFAERVEEAYRCLNLFDEHTWGLDVKITLKGQRFYGKEAFQTAKALPCYRRIERSWDEQRERVANAKAIVEELKDEMSRREEAVGEKKWLTAYNLLTWEASPWLPLKMDAASARDGEGNPLPVFCGEDSLYVRLPGMKPLTARAIHLEGLSSAPAVETAGEAVLENERYLLRASIQRGGVYSLVDKETGREWADAAAGPFGRYEYTIVSKKEMEAFIHDYMSMPSEWIVNDLGRIRYPAVEHRNYTGACISLTHVGRTQLTLRYEMPAESREAYGNASSLRMTVTLLPGDGVRLDYTLTGKEETSYLEQGNFIFPFQAESPSFRVNKLGNVLDPAADVVRNANHVFYGVDCFAQVREGAEAMTMVSRDIPLLSIGLPGAFRFCSEFGDRAPVFYWNAFNNMWGTNFPQWNGGDYAFSFTLFADDGQGSYERALTAAGEPLLLSGRLPELSGNAIGLSSNAELISLSGEKTDWILRLHEISGSEGEMKVTLPDRTLRSVQLCDLYNEPVETLSPGGREISLPVKPYEVITLRLIFA